MGIIKNVTLIGCLCLLPLAAWANSTQHNHTPYAGYQIRDIKSLSDKDIEDIELGRGWGLALPAELNGLPGPVHLLELKEKLSLTPEQVARIEEIYETMRAEAVAAGRRFIEAERKLSVAFKIKNLDQTQLASLVAKAEKARAELRYIHLSRHLMTPDILTTQQIDRYAILRGYADDPCSNIPKGHNEQMWRKHNNCQ